MNAKARTARQTLRDRTRTQRAQARIARTGAASLTTHAIAAGLTPTRARLIAARVHAPPRVPCEALRRLIAPVLSQPGNTHPQQSKPLQSSRSSDT